MKKVAIILTIFLHHASFAQSTDIRYEDSTALKRLGVGLIWMTIEPTSVLQHSSVHIIFPTSNELKLAAQDNNISEEIRNIFSAVSKDERSYLIPYSVFLFQVGYAQKKIFDDINGPSDGDKKINLLMKNLNSGNFTFKTNITFEKNYVDNNKLTDKVKSCEITIPYLEGKSITFTYVCYKYDSGYKLGLPGDRVNWHFFNVVK